MRILRYLYGQCNYRTFPRKWKAGWNKLVLNKMPKYKDSLTSHAKESSRANTKRRLFFENNPPPRSLGWSSQPVQECQQENWSWCETAPLVLLGQVGRSCRFVASPLAHSRTRRWAQILYVLRADIQAGDSASPRRSSCSSKWDSTRSEWNLAALPASEVTCVPVPVCP